MKRVHRASALLAGLLLSAAVFAVDVEGVSLPLRVRIDANAPELVLNGAGVRVRLIFKVYVAALYLPVKMDDGEAILRENRPTRLFMQMLRDLTGEQITSSFNDALRETLTPEERLPLELRLRQFNAIFEALPELREGTQIAIDYLPRRGTVISVNGEKKERIPGADFNRAVLRMWLGDRPRDPELKKALLGIRAN